ncbi:hypothetical protein ACFLUU_08265 [Chloroflexota bacterium]
MEIATFFSVLLGYAISAIPAVVFWIAVIVFVKVKLHRSGGRAERFLIAGAVLEIISSLLRIPLAGVSPWLFHKGFSMTYISSVTLVFGIIPDVISMVGITFLVYAFWVKFKIRNIEGVQEGHSPS